MKEKADFVSPTLESYLENIQVLQKKYGAVRTTDLAETMGCRMPSVTSALRRLAKLNLINYETYRPVTLTTTGETFVRKLSCRHRILADFFKTILVLPENQAEAEACLLEHEISLPILHRIEQFMHFVRSKKDAEKSVAAQQKEFLAFLGKKKTMKPAS